MFGLAGSAGYRRHFNGINILEIPMEIFSFISWTLIHYLLHVFLFRMLTLYNREFPQLSAALQQPPVDFSKLKAGVDYYITYNDKNEQVRMLVKDFEKLPRNPVTGFKDFSAQTLSPPSTRSGARYSTPASLPVKWKFPDSQLNQQQGSKQYHASGVSGSYSNYAQRGNNQGARSRGGSGYGRGHSQGGRRRSTQGKQEAAIDYSARGGYGHDPRGKPYKPSQSSQSHHYAPVPPPSQPVSETYSQALQTSSSSHSSSHNPCPGHTVPDLSPDALTLSSLYTEVKNCLGNLHNELHGHNTGLFSKILDLDKIVKDGDSGLDALALKLEDVQTDISHSSGVKQALITIQKEVDKLKKGKVDINLGGTEAEFLQKTMDGMSAEQDAHRMRIELLIGIVTRQQEQLDSLKLANAGNVANNIIDNVVIGGIPFMERENCKRAARNFFIDKMGLDPHVDDILFAERMGKGIIKGDMEFPPLMKVCCAPFFRQMVWDKRQCLNGQRDPYFKWKFFVDLQCPDVFKAAHNRYKGAMEKVLADNEGKEHPSTPKVRGTKLFVDGEMVPDPIYVPTPKDILLLSLKDHERLESIIIEESTSYTLSDSTFKAFCSKVTSYEEVKRVYQKLKIDHVYATHIMMACAFKEGPGVEIFSCDDGEDGGGLLLEKMISSAELLDHALFVARWKLGGNMGAHHFKCIEAVATQVIRTVKTKEEMRPASPQHSDQVRDNLDNPVSESTPNPSPPANNLNAEDTLVKETPPQLAPQPSPVKTPVSNLQGKTDASISEVNAQG